MLNPNSHFQATLQLISVFGMSINAEAPNIPFLKNDAVVLRASFRKTVDGNPIGITDLSAVMKLGTQEIPGVAVDYAQSLFDFTLSSAITALLTAGVQDASFILTRPSSGAQTFIRIPDAIQPAEIA